MNMWSTLPKGAKLDIRHLYVEVHLETVYEDEKSITAAFSLDGKTIFLMTVDKESAIL